MIVLIGKSINTLTTAHRSPPTIITHPHPDTPTHQPHPSSPIIKPNTRTHY